jgi:hypothetical protein
VIWANHEAEYFCAQDWTTQIRLILFDNFLFWRKPDSAVQLVITGLDPVIDPLRKEAFGEE